MKSTCYRCLISMVHGVASKACFATALWLLIFAASLAQAGTVSFGVSGQPVGNSYDVATVTPSIDPSVHDVQCFNVVLPAGLFRVDGIRFDYQGIPRWWQGRMDDPNYCVDPQNPIPLYIGALEVTDLTEYTISVGEIQLYVDVYPASYAFSPRNQAASQGSPYPYLTGTRGKSFPYYVADASVWRYRLTSPNCVRVPDDQGSYYTPNLWGVPIVYANGVAHYLVDDTPLTFYIGLPSYTTVFDAYEMNQDQTCNFAISYAAAIFPFNASVDYKPFEINSADTTCHEDCSEAGSPINLTTGNTWITQQDYSIPGIGGGLSLTRTWNSMWRRMNPPFSVGLFGDSWISEWEQRLQISLSTIVLWNANGSQWTFTWSDTDNAYILSSPPDEKATLVRNQNGNLTLRLKDGTKYVFNSSGQLRRTEDRNGNRRTLSWSGTKLNSVTDDAGRALTFSYAGGNPNLVTSVSFGSKTVATFTYSSDSNQYLLKVDYPDHSGYNFRYLQSPDTWMQGLIEQVQDVDGKVLEAHTYDVYRRGLTSGRANVNGTGPVEGITVAYNPFNGESVLTNSLGDITSYDYTTISRRDFITGATGVGCATCGSRGQNWFNRDQSGLVMSHVVPTSSASDPMHRITYSYDSRNNITSVSQALNDSGGVGFAAIIGGGGGSDYQTWNYKYNNFAEVTQQTDPLGNVTRNTYDDNGNLLSTVAPDTGTTTFTYDARGDVLSVTDPLGNTSQMTYAPAGLLDTVTDALLNVTHYEYDAEGNRTAIVDAAGNRTQFTYDARNRLSGTLFPDGTSEAITYDNRGRKTSFTSHGVRTTYMYDDADRLAAVTDPNGTTRYTYNTEDELTSITDALNHTTTYTWGAPTPDAGRRLLQTAFPSGAVESYTYDNAGRVILTTLRDGGTVSATYDTFGRMTQKSFADSTGTNQGTITYTYDLVNHLTQVVEPAGTFDYTYDDRGRVKKSKTAYNQVPSKTFTLRYAYDLNSNRTQMIAPGGETVDYTYDAMSRATGLVDSAAGGFSFAYDGLGRRTTLTRPNGISTTYSYDAGSKLLSLAHQGTAVLDGAAYAYNANGNRTQRTDLRTLTVDRYTYDGTNQLTRVDEATPTTALAVKERFLYDALGNRLGAARPTNTYGVSNELLATPKATYSYNANGNLETVTDTALSSYTWNALGQLLSVQSGTTTTSFTYDYLGRRVSKDGTFYVYDGGDIVEEVNADGSGAGRFVHGVGTDEHLAVRRGGVWYYYEQDGLGSVTSLTDATGTIAVGYSYTAFGKSTRDVGALNQPYRYTGREWDNETGLYYYRARYYDPTNGRFISEDPIGFAAGANFYSYVHGAPTSSIDPLGLLDVYIWKFRGKSEAWGHASMTLENGTHVSWWPMGEGRKYKFGTSKIPIYTAPAFEDQTLAKDKEYEEQGPDEVIHIEGLDEDAIAKWWENFQQNRKWKTLSRNCSTVVALGLRAGGAKPVHHLIWTPKSVQKYAEQIAGQNPGSYIR